MKTMKKILAFVLATVMTLAMSVTAFADTEGYSIVINNATNGHTYEAYQIFAGDLSADQQTLSNIKWGSGISEAGQSELGDAVAYAEELAKPSNKSPEATAAELSKYLTTPAGTVSAPTDGKYVISNLSAGYYLIKDRDESLNGKNDSYTSFILKLVKSVTVDPKADTTTVEKKLKDTNDTTGETTNWQDGADYDIGDTVPFKLTATLADNVSSYKTYKLVFHDTISKGLTYNNDVHIYLGEEGTGIDITSGFKAEYNDTSLKFSCDDVKALGATNNSVITVVYSAKLNENAVLGKAGNPNKVKLEFSNNPNINGEGETGFTPEDTVIVFTYQVVVNKVDQDKKPLKGAEFTLYKKLKDGTEKEIQAIKAAEGTSFTFKGLDDGDYVLKETKTPDGYNTINDIKFTVTADHDIISDSPALNKINGDKVSGQIKFTPNVDEGSLDTIVENKKGSVLPETGGAGRVMIYVLGSILVLGAGIVLVSKKRVSR